MPFSSFTLERAFYRVICIEISKIQLPAWFAAILGLIENMFLFCRTLKDNFAFLCSQLGKRYVGAYSHRTAHIRHQRPHQGGIPGRDRTARQWSRIRPVPGILINGANHPCPTGAAGPLAVKGQFLR